MGKQSVIQNPIREGYAVLTPQVFRVLDRRVRKQSGGVLTVCTPDEIHGLWGSAGGLAGDVFIDTRLLGNAEHEGGVCDQAADIRITNQIKVLDFQGAQRPEIDLRKIPANRIYEYLVWHEMGHLLENFDPWGLFGKGVPADYANRDDVQSALSQLNEVMADRFAWSQMFPDQRLPVRRGKAHMKGWAKEWGDRLSSNGVRRRMAPHHPCSTEIWASVPTAHVYKDIPWCDLVRSEEIGASEWEACLARARIEVKSYEVRSFLARARREMERWARISNAPLREVKEAMEHCKSGRPLSGFMFEDEKRALIQECRASAEAQA